jgi:hypothetical protein
MNATPTPALRFGPGDVLAGKYRVESVLGVGGMGVVVAAHHIQLDERVALKFLLPEALTNPEAVARFVREARAAVKIKSEHVARVTDVGQLENGSPYMVMEYLDGGDLAAWIRQRGAMPIDQAVDFVLQACEAIAEAHALGIVHRDLKPANLFCVRRADGQLSIKVLDFGISKVTQPGAPGHDMTSTIAVVGSPLYMSPEQLQSSKSVDARTDIWSLGILLFELLTGRVPFEGETVTELVIKIATAPAPPVSSLRADIPARLVHVIATCLDKARERRFPSVGDLALALTEFGSKRARASVERILDTLRAVGMSSAQLPSSGAHHPLVAIPGTLPSTAAAWGQTGGQTGGQAGARTGAGPRATGKVVAAISGGCLLVVAIGASAVLVKRAHVAPAPGPSAAAAAVVAPPAPSPAPVSIEPVSAAQAAAVTAPPASTSPPPPSTTTPTVPPATIAQAPAGTRPQVAPSPKPGCDPLLGPCASPAPAPAPAPVKPSCDPPYYVNAKGSRIFKKECL